LLKLLRSKKRKYWLKDPVPLPHSFEPNGDQITTMFFTVNRQSQVGMHMGQASRLKIQSVHSTDQVVK